MLIDVDLTAVNVIESRKQVDDGRFSCPSRADQRDGLAGFGMDIDFLEDWNALFITEIDIFEADFAMDIL